MADQHLNIHLKLVDEFSKSVSGVLNSVDKTARRIGEVSRQLNQVGTRMIWVGGAITGSFALAMKGVAEYSPSVNKALNDVSSSMRNFQMTIAESVAPSVQKFANLLSNLVDAFNKLDPAIRNTIINATFVTGVVLLSVGSMLKLAGAIGVIFSKILLSLNPVSIALIGIAGATAILISHWEQVEKKIVPVINALQIGFSMVAIGVWKVVQGLLAMNRLSPAYLIPQVRKLNDELSRLANTSIKQLEKDMTRIIETGSGSWADSTKGIISSTKNMIEEFKSMLSEGSERGTAALKGFAKAGIDASRQIASAMQQSLGNFFYNVLTNQLSSAKEAFADFGRSVLQILTQMFARLLLLKTIGNMSFFGVKGSSLLGFHTGGVIKKAHSGMLASDEVPIIAQAGEGIISRKGMASLGIENFNRLNKGEVAKGSSPTIVIYQSIQAMDSRDVYRNRKVIAQGIIDELRKNGEFRFAIKEYA